MPRNCHFLNVILERDLSLINHTKAESKLGSFLCHKAKNINTWSRDINYYLYLINTKAIVRQCNKGVQIVKNWNLYDLSFDPPKNHLRV